MSKIAISIFALVVSLIAAIGVPYFAVKSKEREDERRKLEYERRKNNRF